METFTTASAVIVSICAAGVMVFVAIVFREKRLAMARLFEWNAIAKKQERERRGEAVGVEIREVGRGR